MTEKSIDNGREARSCHWSGTKSPGISPMLVAQCSKCKNLIEVEPEQQTVRCGRCRLVQKVGRIGEICPSTDPVDMRETLRAILEGQKRRMPRTERTPSC
jgi:hypothetical protein